MRLGEFTVIVEDASGHAVESVTRDGVFPRVGEEWRHRGATYVVNRVVHEPDDDRDDTIWRVTSVTLHVRPPAVKRRAPAFHVEPLQLPPVADAVRDCAGLPPSLVALLVWIGYACERQRLRSRTRAVSRIHHTGDGWVLDPHDSPSYIWRQAQRAARYREEARLFCDALAEHLSAPPPTARPPVALRLVS